MVKKGLNSRLIVKVKNIINNDIFFFCLLYVALIILFQKAFNTAFFADDYFFLRVSRIKTLSQFLYFFYPLKDYFYRPLPTELFYFIIHRLNYDLILSHSLVFGFYFTGLYFLYKIIADATKNKLFAKLTIVFYSISFIHVFQLYWLATFQEIALFTFLAISFYCFIRKKYFVSLLFFVFALMSKETALVFPFFLCLYEFWHQKRSFVGRIPFLIPYFFLFILFLLINKYSIGHVAVIDTYKIQLNPKLILNNSMWYILWGMGLPNFMPDYLPSIFASPLPDFWNLLQIRELRIYFNALILYLISITIGFLVLAFKKQKDLKPLVLICLGSLLSFFIFVSPTLPIFHKWMVRLTIPLVFLSLLQAYVLFTLAHLNKYLLGTAIVIFSTYVIFNYYGIKTHEFSSLYALETRIAQNAKIYFVQNKHQILNNRFVYFKNGSGSVKLKTSFHDQDFLDYFFPGANLKAIYGHEENKIPRYTFIVDSDKLLQ